MQARNFWLCTSGSVSKTPSEYYWTCLRHPSGAGRMEVRLDGICKPLGTAFLDPGWTLPRIRRLQKNCCLLECKRKIGLISCASKSFKRQSQGMSLFVICVLVL